MVSSSENMDASGGMHCNLASDNIFGLAYHCCRNIFLLVIISTFLPLPHEVLLLRYYKTHKDALEKEKNRGWLVTTTALLRFYELKIRKSRGLIKRQDVQIAFIDEC